MLRLALVSVSLALFAFLLRSFTRPVTRTADALDQAAAETAAAAVKG